MKKSPPGLQTILFLLAGENVRKYPEGLFIYGGGLSNNEILIAITPSFLLSILRAY